MKNVADVKLKVFRKCNERKTFFNLRSYHEPQQKIRDILYWNLDLNLSKQAPKTSSFQSL